VPSPPQILAGLAGIAHQAQPLAVAWHVIALATMGAVAAGWRPSRRLAASLLTLPLWSVAVLAWASGNPFNGTMFVVFGATLGILGLRMPPLAVPRPPRWSLSFGVAMVAFGLVYPHFVATDSWLTYLYKAPTGLVPCPTLSLVIGVALVTDGLGSRAWSLVLAAAGILYGVFGVARLGVTLDFGLLVGALALAVLGVSTAMRGPAAGAGRANHVELAR